jgi:hypothetical protein
MKKILFLMSHIGANSNHLHNILTDNSIIDSFKSDTVYEHPDDLNLMLMKRHKNDNAASIYMDELLHNYRLTCKPLCKICQFIFLLGEPKPSINRICSSGYTIESAVRYYCFRLRGMYEYYLRSGGIFCKLEESELQKITDYLGLRDPLIWKEPDNSFEDIASYSAVKECEDCYDRYLHHLTNH